MRINKEDDTQVVNGRKRKHGSSFHDGKKVLALSDHIILGDGSIFNKTKSTCGTSINQVYMKSRKEGAPKSSERGVEMKNIEIK
jgi:hypothetical protein